MTGTTSTLVDIFAEEPPDGTRLAVWAGGDPTVIWRDDTEAGQWYGAPDKRWFHDSNRDPMCFREILAEATMVHAVVPLGRSGLALVDPEDLCPSCPEDAPVSDSEQWAVRHAGLGIIHYASEAWARVAAGTAGTVLVRRAGDEEWCAAESPKES